MDLATMNNGSIGQSESIFSAAIVYQGTSQTTPSLETDQNNILSADNVANMLNTVNLNTNAHMTGPFWEHL